MKKTMTQPLGRGFLTFLFGLFSAVWLLAQPYTFIGGDPAGPKTWTIAGNWQGGLVPPVIFSGQTININADCEMNTSQNVSNGSTLNVNAPFRIGVGSSSCGIALSGSTMNVAGAGGVNVASNGDLTFQIGSTASWGGSGSNEISGTVSMLSSTATYSASTILQIKNGGKWRNFSGSTTNFNETLNVQTGGNLKNLATMTTSASATLSVSGLLENSGTLTVNGNFSLSGNFSTTGSTAFLSGYFSGSSSQFLNLAGAATTFSTTPTFNGFFDNHANFSPGTGIVVANNFLNRAGATTTVSALSYAASGVILNEGTLNCTSTAYQSGYFTNSSGATVNANGFWESTAEFSNNGTFIAGGASTVNLKHLFSNVSTGIFEVNTDGYCRVFSGSTFSNDGILKVKKPFDQQGFFTMSGGQIQTFSGGSINNIGSFAVNGGTWNGTVPINQNGGTMTIGPGASFSQSEQIMVAAGATLNFHTASGLGGAIQNDGTINCETNGMTFYSPILNQNGSVFNVKSHVIIAGTMTNSGSLFVTPSGFLSNLSTINSIGTFSNAGIMAGYGGFPGGAVHSNSGIFRPQSSTSATGTLAFTGLFEQTSAGLLEIEIASAADFDLLVANGGASLGGTLQVNLLNGFVPSLCQEFTIMTFGNAPTGAFSAVNFPSGKWSIIETLTELKIKFHGFDYTFVGPGNVFSDPNNWAGCLVPPTPTDAAISIDHNCFLDQTITTGAAFTVQPSRELLIQNGRSLTVGGGESFTNFGELLAGFGTSLIVSGYGLLDLKMGSTFYGSGVLTLTEFAQLENRGTFYYSGASFSMLPGATFENHNSSIFNFSSPPIWLGECSNLTASSSLIFDASPSTITFGSGSIFDNEGTFSTYSNLEVNGSFTVQPSGSVNVQPGRSFLANGPTVVAGDFVVSTSSTLTIDGGSTFEIATGGELTNNFSVLNEGTLVQNGAFVNVGASTFSLDPAATLKGAGLTTVSTLDFNGALKPGNSPGELTFSGTTFTFLPTATTEIELESAVSFDQITITGAAALNGTLDLRLFGGFVPAVCDQFLVLTATSVSGAFSNFLPPAGTMASEWDIEYGPTSVKIIYAGTGSVRIFDNDGGAGDGFWETNANWDVCAAPKSPLVGTAVIAENCEKGAGLEVDGILKVEVGKGLTLGGDLILNAGGAAEIDGSIDLDGNGIFENHGSMSGKGSITGGAATNFGLFEPGNAGDPTAAFSFGAAFSNGAAGEIRLEIGGTAAGLFDEITIAGAMHLNGTLTVVLVGGFVPAACDEFVLMTAASRMGTFSTVNLPGAGGDWLVLYDGTTVKLKFISSTQYTFTNAGGDFLWSNVDNWAECYAPSGTVTKPILIQQNCIMDQTVIAENDVTLAAGKSLTIQNGQLLEVVGSGFFTNNGSVVNDGNLSITGDGMSFLPTATVDNRGEFFYAVNSAALVFDGTILNSGDFYAEANSISTAVNLAATGAGGFNFYAIERFSMAGKMLSSVDGSISITANEYDDAGAGELGGIDLVNSSIAISGSGNLSMHGRGGKFGSSGNHGIRLFGSGGGSTTVLEAGSGGISLEGFGGSDDNGAHHGIHVGANSSIKTTGAGSLHLTATGGAGSAGGNHGIFVSGLQSAFIETADGNIQIECIGGMGAGGDNDGLRVDAAIAGPILKTTGAGGLNIIAQGGFVGNGNEAILLNNARFSTNSAAISVLATAGAGNSDGLNLASSARISSETGAVNVTSSGSGTGAGIRGSGGSQSKFQKTTSTGPLTVTTDKWDGVGIASSGSATIQPIDPAASVGIGDFSAGSLKFTNGDLASFDATLSSLTFGDAAAGTGVLDLMTNDPNSLKSNMNFYAGSILATQFQAVGKNVLLHARTGDVFNDELIANFQADQTTIETPSGAFKPGASPGIVNVTGNLKIVDKLEVELEGASLGQFDRLSVFGELDITGAALEVVFLSGFVPTASNTFQIAAMSSRVGSFSPITWPSGYSGNVVETATSVTLGGVALPIELLDFSAKNEVEKVVLSWKTASESQNRGFFIERLPAEKAGSQNGNDWIALGFEAGKGTTNEPSFYFFEDKKPLAGLAFYRLRQVDLDEKTTFSNVVSVDRKSEKGQLQLFPNPTDDGFLTLFFDEKSASENATARLFDPTGRLLETIFFENGKSQKLDLSGQPSGIFWLEIETEKELFQQKIIRR